MKITEMLTIEQLRAATLASKKDAERVLPHLISYLDQYAINTPIRLAHFLAQIAHESQRLSRLEENLNYSAAGLAKTWPNRFYAGARAETGLANAADYANQPEKIANLVYANRGGNGSVASGDGWRYRGRGLLQTTLKNNYGTAGRALALPLLEQPELLTDPEHAVRSAAYYWQSRGCNYLADKNDVLTITRRINGGTNGLDERIALANVAQSALGAIV